MRALAALALCVIGCGQDPFRDYPELHPVPTDVWAMTFNIRWDNAGDGADGWEQRKEHVLAVIQREQPDVIGLQETMRTQRDWLGEKLSSTHTSISIAADGGEVFDSMLLFRRSRFKAVRIDQFWLGPEPDVPLSRFSSVGFNPPRTMSCIELADENNDYRRFWFCNTHLSGGHIGELQAGVIRHRFLGYAYRDASIILTGDFNAFPFRYEEWPMSPPSPPWLWSARDWTYDVLTTDMVDGFRVVHPNNTMPSGCGLSGPCASFNFDARIDWVLHTRDMRTTASRMVMETWEGHNVSDHWPIISTIEFADEAR